jgi:hypothetical protein
MVEGSWSAMISLLRSWILEGFAVLFVRGGVSNKFCHYFLSNSAAVKVMPRDFISSIINFG